MGLEQLQQALAKLYTDATLRAEFLADPDDTSVTLGLSTVEAVQLTAVSVQQIECFAQSLRRKRADEVRSLLPYTCRALGKSFGQIFSTYSETFCPQGCHKHRDDALQFVVYLTRNARCQNVAANVIDIARFEAAALRMSQYSDRVLIRLFRHDVRQSIFRVKEGRQIAQEVFRPSAGIWFRIGSITRFRIVVFPSFASLSDSVSELNHLT
ncbi:hypothetical protein CA54_58240 [Symmachiella macrocystis]|uniref:SCO6045-like C-terminal domain-containing protein n=1 Tax=Symmachiella macrocystis TaxID=2527985 RepID=A0A5C6B1M1_9PLAN|nr:hypothetical protein [Symmachiella macrocystis]TWU05136.1 hypothetical protein CA54_58240 [Symmachiella macrocystis]